MSEEGVGDGKIWDLEAKCPRCGSKYVISEYLYTAPLIGRVILSTGECGNCGYRHRDIRAAESMGPQKLKLSVDDPEDLNAIVVRASSASIYIPDFGVSIEPGPASQGFITTVEGVLNRVLDIMNILGRDDEVDKERWRSVKEELERARRGEKGFTLIIVDPEGVSRIISDKVEKERLYSS